MSGAHRCPHCKAELPEKAMFCGACGRRIEGWNVPPPQSGATPAFGDDKLPSGDEATRQMEPTPSLLRAAALSLRKRRRAPPIVAMIVVAAVGAAAAFFVVRANMRKRVVASAPVASAPVASVPVVAAAPASPTPTPTPTPTAVPVKRKHAHVVSAAPVINVKAKKVKAVKVAAGAGLPHKSVETDSKSMAQQESQSQKAMALPTVEHETTSESTPHTEAEMKQEAEARLDADSVRFVVKAHLPQVRACYGRAFKDSSPGGTVEIGFAIDSAGHAQNVRTETNTTDSEQLAHCLEERVKQWQFPKPVGGDYELIYPFVFAPGS